MSSKSSDRSVLNSQSGQPASPPVSTACQEAAGHTPIVVAGTGVALEVPMVTAVQERLRSWFRRHGRDLPWRKTRDPYHILVAEVMLQQTQVDRVLPYYTAFLERFPTLQALAEASPAEVIRLWAGLGYNRRAVNLQRVAQRIVQQHGGRFPRSVEELRTLPGIGAYTAGAIACFAFEHDVAFLDTNIRRVLHRIFIGPDVPHPRASDRALSQLAAQVVPQGGGWEWNQAVMEFGAVHCTARKPACSVCPVQAHCRAFPAILTAIQEHSATFRARDATPFAGSSRWYRGRILAALRDAPPDQGLTLADIGQQVREGFTDADLPWLQELVSGLARDGLAIIAEEPAHYDTTPSDPSRRRVRLPDS